MSVHGEEERNKEVVGVPKSLERLLSYLMVCGGVHEQHDQKHDVASNTACLSIMDLDSRDRSDLALLDVEEVDVVSTYVDRGEHQQGVGALPMKPLRLVERKPLELGSQKSHEIPAHGQENQEHVYGQDKSCSSRQPYRKCECVESS